MSAPPPRRLSSLAADFAAIAATLRAHRVHPEISLEYERLALEQLHEDNRHREAMEWQDREFERLIAELRAKGTEIPAQGARE